MRSIWSAVLVGLLVSHSPAASPQKKQTNKRPAAVATKVRVTPSIDQLYIASSTSLVSPSKPSCLVSAFSQFAARLATEHSDAFADKGEFESTDEYVQRLTKFGEAIERKELVSCSDLNSAMTASKYDADTQTFEFTASDRFEISYVRKFMAAYTGQTAMGVRFKVTPAVVVMHRLNSGGSFKSLLSMCGVLYGDTLKIKVSPEKAVQLRDSGILSIAGKMERPWVTMEDSHDVASLTDPTEWYIREFEDHLAVTQARIMLPDGTVLLECVRP